MSSHDLEEVVFLVEEDAESGGYSASCSRWGIYTQGDDLAELRTMVREAVECRFEAESTTPRRIRLHFVRDEIIAA